MQKSKTYIDWYGTFVITPELKENRGKASTVKVATEVCNRSSLSSEYKLVTEVRKLNGEAVTSVTTTPSMSGQMTVSNLCRLRLP